MVTILYVDLEKNKIKKKPEPEKLRSKFIGDRGINAHLLWSLMKPGIDCFSPENVLIFGTGPLTGTAAPSCGKSSIVCKGAETGLYLKTSMGGHWSAELRFAGYDHLVIRGASRKPVYLWINDATVEMRPATHLWGRDVRETDKALKEELGHNVKVICIGPGGENLVRFASIMSSIYHAAARGGAGAVMGSKKLKAIAIKGTGEVTVKDPGKLYKIAAAIREGLERDDAAVSLHRYGTAKAIGRKNELYSLTGHNWRVFHVDNIYPITGECFVNEGYLKRRGACFGCNIGCMGYMEIDSGPYSGTYTGHVQLVTTTAFGAGTGTISTEAVIKANDLCDLYGLDTASTAHAIEWAMECYEKGLLTKEDTEGMDLNFGSTEAVFNLIPQIANRNSKLGNLLAEGVHRAADKVGKGSWKIAMCNSKGLPITRVDLRICKGYALAFAVNPRGPDHLHTETIAEWGMTDEALELIEKITGDKKWANTTLLEYKPEIVRWHEDCYAITEALGLCVFTSTSSYVVNPKNMAEMFSAATGIEMTEEEIMKAGRRILTLEKCFNIREGADRRLDDLPYRMMNEKVTEGPYKGMITSVNDLNKMLDRYYELHEWDPKTSWPYEKTLVGLGLYDCANQLKKLGRTPPKGFPK